MGARDVGEVAAGAALLKAALNADSDGAVGLHQFAGDATLLYYMSEEAQEGREASWRSASPTSGASRAGRDGAA